MLFNSLDFLVFFPVVTLFYFVLPKGIRYVWLLAASYFFYMCWNVKYALLLLFSTLITYFSGLLIGFFQRCPWPGAGRWKKLCVAGSFLANLAVLFFFKYFNFAFNNLAAGAELLGVQLRQPTFDVLLPVGISFYTFQTLGYALDVYRGEVKAEKNVLKYALFVSFFPQLVAGPIERSRNLLKQIHMPKDFQVQNARYGVFTMAYGLFLKMVIADKIAAMIDPILEQYACYPGAVVGMCVVLFAFQIYCDFHGYTQIAIGSAKVLGFELQENFRAPFLAGSIENCWRSWHISLTTWFTDYLYIPLGGNRKGRVRKQINTMIVFLSSGLWHGAAWNYVVWGGLNGLYLVVSDVTRAARKRWYARLRVDTCSLGWKVLSRTVTFALFDYALLYFRADGLGSAFRIQRHIFGDFHLEFLFSDQFWALFGSSTALFALAAGLLFMLATDYCQYKGIDWKQRVLEQQVVYRWFVYLSMLFIILLFGAYGVKNGQTQFIYFQF